MVVHRFPGSSRSFSPMGRVVVRQSEALRITGRITERITERITGRITRGITFGRKGEYIP